MASENSPTALFKRSGRLLYRKYREFFLPTLLASISSSMAIIIDSIIVGNMLGSNEMASVNLCLPVMQAYITLAILVGMGSSTLIAIALGRRDAATANSIFTTAALVALFFGLLLTVVMVPFSDSISRLLTTDQTLLPLVSSYIHVFLYGGVLFFFVPIFAYILRTDGMVKLASMLLIITNLVNLLLDIVFIGPCGMGIAGSALATVCGYAAGAGFLIFYACSKRRTLHFVPLLRRPWKETLSRIGKIVNSGFPAALSGALITVKILCINLLIGYLSGNSGLIVFSVCLSCLSFVSMFISGTAGAMMPIMGTLYGERDFKGVKLIFGYTLRFALLMTAGIIVLFEFMPAHVFALFGVTDPELLIVGIPSLRLFSISLFGVTISFLLIFHYMTIQRQLIASTLSALEGVLVLIPAAWLLSSVMGITGVWLAFILAEIVALCVTYMISRKVVKRSGGKYQDMLLIERNDPQLLCDISLKATKQNASNLSTEVIQVLKNCSLDDSIAMKAGIALEEMIDNAATYVLNRKHTVDVDVRISSIEEGVVISMRDNGVYFNPLEYQAEEKEFSIDGIMLLRAIASKLTYNRVLALNQTLIVINKDKNI